MHDDSSDDEECNEEECDEESSSRGQQFGGEPCDKESSNDEASLSNSDSIESFQQEQRDKPVKKSNNDSCDDSLGCSPGLSALEADKASKSLDITANAAYNKTDTENVQPNTDQQDQSIKNRMDLEQRWQDELYVEEPKHSKESFKKPAEKTCDLIRQVIRKDLGGLGHSGDGRGSIDGEITQSTCKSIVKLANITDQDVIFDAGCSGGGALMTMVALANAKAGIGMEIDDNRYAIANLHNHSLMKNRDISVPVHFLHKDVTTLTTFEGITVLYMWDRAFVPSFYDNVAEAIRKSYSLRCLISEKKRDFWEKLMIPLKETSKVNTIDLTAIGGSCTDTLYVYEIEPVCDPDLIEKDESYWILNDSIDIATNFDKRQQTASSKHSAWLNKKERKPKLNLYTILDQEENIQDLELMKTYYPNGRLKKYEPTEFTTRAYTMYRCESEFGLYYRPNLHMVSILEINAMKYTFGKETGALIVPSYDVEMKTILIGMQYRYAPKNNKVTCSIYNIKTKAYTFVMNYQDVKAGFNFDHTVNLPVDLNTYEQILKGFRVGFYRLSKEESATTEEDTEDTELGATTSADGESQTKRPRISKPPERWVSVYFL